MTVSFFTILTWVSRFLSHKDLYLTGLNSTYFYMLKKTSCVKNTKIKFGKGLIWKVVWNKLEKHVDSVCYSITDIHEFGRNTSGGKMNNQCSWLTNLYSVFDSEFRLLKSLKNLDRRFLSPDFSTFLETFFGDDFQNKLSADIFWIHFLDKEWKRLWILLCRAPIAMFLYFVLSKWISYIVVT